MPFDGAEFLQKAPPSGAPSTPDPSKLVWYRRLATALRRQVYPELRQPGAEETGDAVVRLLEDARDLIASPEHWVRGTYETATGRRCAVGALSRAAHPVRQPATLRRAHMELLRVALKRGFRTVEMMNDESQHKNVLSAFDEAIVAARRRAVVPVVVRGLGAP